MFSEKCTHTHIQIMNPSKISRAIHWSGLRVEWMHSSHNYCGGSHTLHQSIPVSKSPGENSEYVRFPKDIMRFLYLHLRKVERGERDLQSIKVTSWLIHMSEPRPCSWKRRIQWLQMLTWSGRRINLWKNNEKNNLYHPRYIFKNITVFLTREDKRQFREALVWNRRGRESRKRQRCLYGIWWYKGRDTKGEALMFGDVWCLGWVGQRHTHWVDTRNQWRRKRTVNDSDNPLLGAGAIS